MLSWDGDAPAGRAASALALYPPPAVQARLRHDLADRGLPCPSRFHLTLKYSFFRSAALEECWERIERLVAATPPLQLRSCGVLPSPETFCHLLLIEPDPHLMRLHEEVVDVLTACGSLVSPLTARFEGVGYTPHITLSYGATPIEFEMHAAMLAEYDPQIRFIVSAVERVDQQVEEGGVRRARTITRTFSFSPIAPAERPV